MQQRTHCHIHQRHLAFIYPQVDHKTKLALEHCIYLACCIETILTACTRAVGTSDTLFVLLEYEVETKHTFHVGIAEYGVATNFGTKSTTHHYTAVYIAGRAALHCLFTRSIEFALEAGINLAIGTLHTKCLLHLVGDIRQLAVAR